MDGNIWMETSWGLSIRRRHTGVISPSSGLEVELYKEFDRDLPALIFSETGRPSYPLHTSYYLHQIDGSMRPHAITLVATGFLLKTHDMLIRPVSFQIPNQDKIA
jgi:hypothetical protein